MSHTLRVDTKDDTKVNTGMLVLRLDVASPIGSGLISLVRWIFLINLTLGKIFQTQRMMPNL